MSGIVSSLYKHILYINIIYLWHVTLWQETSLVCLSIDIHSHLLNKSPSHMIKINIQTCWALYRVWDIHTWEQHNRYVVCYNWHFPELDDLDQPKIQVGMRWDQCTCSTSSQYIEVNSVVAGTSSVTLRDIKAKIYAFHQCKLEGQKKYNELAIFANRKFTGQCCKVTRHLNVSWKLMLYKTKDTRKRSQESSVLTVSSLHGNI